MNKCIEYGKIWECENLDNLAPITREGMCFLLKNGEKEYVWENEPDYFLKVSQFKKASEKEVKEFYKKRGYLFIGDEVEIIKGKKLPIGEKKIIKSFYRYTIPNTYGKVYKEYICFEDGTNTSISNVKPTCKLNKDVKFFYKFEKGYKVGGRV